MDNVNPKDAYNDAIASVLRGRKSELRMSNDDLAAASGIPERTFSRLLNGERPMRMGQFFALVTALQLDPSYVAAEASKRISVVVGN